MTKKTTEKKTAAKAVTARGKAKVKTHDKAQTTASKRPISKLMFDCLLEPKNILSAFAVNEN